MSSDASAAAASPMTNGVPHEESHREADASTATGTATFSSSKSLPDICADLHERLTRFLDADPSDPVTKRAQEQTRVTCKVIEKALQDYE